jgi:hypothetical protein
VRLISPGARTTGRTSASDCTVLSEAGHSSSPGAGSRSWNIVHETLAGRGERLKGYRVAFEVFGRPETFDPVADPIMRIEAGRRREKSPQQIERRFPRQTTGSV